jgi:hypothetical protein
VELDFEIDKITESIENAETGETLNTLVLPVTQDDLKETTKKNGWLFDWKQEFSEPERQVYKLVAEQEPHTIQGMVSLEKMEDHMFMHLVENAPYNIGKGKKYIEHYEKTLGAVHLGGGIMAIFEEKAKKLIDSYF